MGYSKSNQVFSATAGEPHPVAPELQDGAAPEAVVILGVCQPATSGPATAAAHAGRHLPHGPRRLVSKGWEAERAELLCRAFARIERERASGTTVTKALKRAARRLSALTYRQNGRKVRLSFPTVRRLYYAWLHSGKDESALRLHYRQGKAAGRIASELAAQFLAECCQAPSMSSAYRAVKSRQSAQAGFPTSRAFRAALPSRQRELIKQIHSAKRRERQLAAMVMTN